MGERGGQGSKLLPPPGLCWARSWLLWACPCIGSGASCFAGGWGWAKIKGSLVSGEKGEMRDLGLGHGVL